jgi:hypothetical protein
MSRRLICGILWVHMFDEPDENPIEKARTAEDRAREKSDEFRMHAELAAVFEGCRKFDAQLLPGLDANLARDVQRGIGRLDKAKTPDSPIIPDTSAADAAGLLNLPATASVSTNDYHIHRRPGEVMIIRWLEGEQVEKYYERIQAHFDAAMNAFREEEKTDNEWKHDPEADAYLEALEKVDLKMADRYLRPLIKEHGIFVLSTQTADEMNINYLTNYLIGTDAADVVGAKSAPPDAPTDQDLAWFFKLFSLRGLDGGMEKMCYFTYLQKADDDL